MNVSSIMANHVVLAGPDEPAADVARRLAEHDLSAMPVCDQDGAVLGMVSEGDLLRRFAADHGLPRSWWLGLLAAGERLLQPLGAYLRASGQRPVRELMSSPAITVTESASVNEVARLLLQKHIKRVPVLRDRRMVGIVSRADLVCALALKPEVLDEQWRPASAGSDAPLGCGRR
jgi:CBS domain-containing protein